MTQSVLDDLESPLSSPNGVPAPGGVPPTPQLDLAPPQQPDVPRAFGDTDRTRQLLYDNVRKAASAFQPVANARHTLSLQDVDYHGPETFSIAQQKQAILGRGSPGRKLRGTFVMHDTVSGDEVSRKRVTLATVPHMTQRGTFIHGGTEYTMAHQLRLRPGIFTREKANGEIESHINVSKGLGHRISLDPKSGVFTMNIGQANIPLFPLLKTMGVSESQMRENWGNEITAANMSKDNPKKVSALYKKLCKHGDQDIPDDQKAQSVREAFEKMELDPTVTKRTLGQPFTKVGPDTFLAVTKKLIGVNRGESEVDDRDDLAFQQVMGPEDVFAERLKKPQEALRRILWRASAKGSLDHVPAGAFDEHIRSALLKTGLGQPGEEVNPAEIFDQQAKATRMGEGGLSKEAVPDESRAVQPSQLGFIDFLRTPESGQVGVDFRLAGNARKGADGRLYTQVQPWEHGQSSGALMHKAAPDLSDAVLAFPGEMKRNTPWVTALVDGKVKNVRRDSVQFELPHMEHTFSPLGNMVPLKSMVKGQRAVMAARMITQALPLVDPEAPFVQSGMPDQPGRSYEEEYAKHMGVLRADAPGRVKSVDDQGITVQYQDGHDETHELYSHFPFNRKTFLHQTPVVNPGDMVQPGQLLAHSNFTDKQGTTALGKNLRVAYIPFKGKSFEDAIVISKSAAKRLSSEHMYQHGLDLEDENMTAGKSFFRSMFPGKYSKEQMENFTDDGVIKPGTKVHPGDPLILAARQQPASARSVHRKLSPLDASVTWDHHSEGVVTDIDTTGKGLNVVVKSTAEMAVGDKLSGRVGDKGVISDIVDDDQMPVAADGKPVEVCLNPLGIISRTNPQQVVECALGKIAALTGKPYKIPDFQDDRDMVEWAMAELQKHGMQDLEDVIDPATGRKIPGILVGNRFMMKLHHTSESKAQGRGLGSYTSEHTPAKGGEGGSKRLGILEVNALLSHGATEVMRDARLLRGQANPEYWSQFMQGAKPAVPKIPFTYEKFVNQLKASGIHPVRTNHRTQIMALTSKDVDTLTEGRELRGVPDGRGGTTLETVNWKDLSPLEGGLFDKRITGGHNGKMWSHIKLHEPMPNPAMEEPIRQMLGLTEQKFQDVIRGEEKINGITGPRAIGQALENINLDKDLAACREEIRSGKKTLRDKAVRRLGYLKSAQEMNLHPREWMLDKVPVLPPAFRPVSTLGAKKTPIVDDANHLYKEVFDANSLLRQSGQMLGDHVGEERLNVYNAFKGVTGLGDPIHPKNQEKKVEGILRHVFGCYDDQTEILTETHGWVPFPTLPTDTRVGTLNPQTGAFEWQQPSEFQRYRYCGDMVRILYGSSRSGAGPDGTRLDLLVTPNHRNWVRQRLPCEDLEVGWEIEPAYMTAANGGREWFRTAASAWAGHHNMPAFLPATCPPEDFARLVGWWTAEGWIHSDGQIVNLSQETARNAPYCREIDRVLTSVGLRFTRHDYVREPKPGRKNRTRYAVWAIMSRELVEWLQLHVGELAGQKRLSRFVKDWDRPLLAALFTAYQAGDGGKRTVPAITCSNKLTHKHRSTLTDRHNRLHTTSARLFADCTEICCKLGLVLRPQTGRAAYDNYAELFRGGVDGQCFTQTEGRDGKTLEHYDGFVYCCTVPNSILFVRRNGIPVFSGNSSPKLGVVQRSLLGGSMDLVGRAVIAPDPDLDMDSVGLPEEKAWEIYKPFVVRNLKRGGMQATRAGELIKARSETARKALVEEMGRRPVIINRAPTLHRYGLMAAYPQLVKGDVMKISPLVCSGFNADFDGDAMQFHVPGTDEAAEEAAEKMLPSRNLFAVSNFRIHFRPQKEYIGGIYEASGAIDKQNAPLHYATTADAVRAYKQGKINVDRRIVVHDK